MSINMNSGKEFLKALSRQDLESDFLFYFIFHYPFSNKKFTGIALSSGKTSGQLVNDC